MRKTLVLSVIILILGSLTITFAQEASKRELKNGVNFIETKVYDKEANRKLLKLYQGLRVADVSDGLDYMGLPGVGLVDPAIHPEWEDNQNLSHAICGIALTVRYVPTRKSPQPPQDKKFGEWKGNFYGKYSAETFQKIIQDGHIIMIDDAQSKDIGSIGSMNILAWHKKGARGVVTDARARDTDEIQKQGIPLYLRGKGRGIRPGRNELESVNRPIVIGGVTVCPGDVVVADGDGVVVVPRRVAVEVAEHAHNILKGDKQNRKELYESLNMEPDQTIK